VKSKKSGIYQKSVLFSNDFKRKYHGRRFKMKRMFILLLSLVVVLALFGVAGAPAPPSLPSTTGNVRNDYVDKTSSKKVYYTVEKPDGTQSEVWTDKKHIDRLISRAAAASRQLTVWTEPSGEVAAVETEYQD
jgi:hypothetical protein